MIAMNEPFTNDDLLSVAQAIDGMDDNPLLATAHLGNALAIIHKTLGEGSWVGLYMVAGDELILGAFQGTPACERIGFGKGVVGGSYSQDRTIAVPDVSAYPGYICCDASAKSEICVPVKKNGQTVAIFDVDLPDYHGFQDDQEGFEALAEALANRL